MLVQARGATKGVEAGTGLAEKEERAVSSTFGLILTCLVPTPPSSSFASMFSRGAVQCEKGGV